MIRHVLRVPGSNEGYFDGNTKDYDTALQTFIDKVKTKHPEIEG